MKNHFCINFKKKKIIELHIAHNEGNFFASKELLKKLEDQNIRSGFIRKNIVRLVIHKDINQEDLDKIVEAIVHSSSA